MNFEEDYRSVGFAGLVCGRDGSVLRFTYPDHQLVRMNTFANPDEGRTWLAWADPSEDYAYNGPVDKLVMKAWYEGFEFSMDVRHLNGDDYDNHLSNLEAWYADEAKGYRPIHARNGNVLDRRMGGKIEIVETGEVFESLAACARAIGGQRANIYGVLNGRLRTHKGYTFRWI